MTARLSACLIVRDEIASLGACLDSLDNVADEIAIVDTGSTDGTLELVERRATRFARRAWTDDFAAARNASLDLAEGDWILVIDADEQLVGDRAQLRKAIAAPHVLAYQLEQRNDLGNSASGSAFITRLFRRLPELRYVGRVHEQVGDGVAALMARDPRWQVGRVEGVALAHTGYRPEVVTGRGKSERNAHLLELELAQHPDDYYLYYKLYQARGGGHLLFRSAELLQDMEEAALRKAGVADEILTAAALAWFEVGEHARAERACRTALVLGRHPATLVVLGRALLAMDRAGDARAILVEALALPPSAHDFHVDPRAYERVARLALIQAHLATGDAATALRDGLRWFEAHTTDAVCLRLCADAAEALGHAQDALDWRKVAAQLSK
jgi:tetratricopeptide (TPR) repeat protein